LSKWENRCPVPKEGLSLVSKKKKEIKHMGLAYEGVGEGATRRGLCGYGEQITGSPGGQDNKGKFYVPPTKDFYQGSKVVCILK
jgi:hypothetical protein